MTFGSFFLILMSAAHCEGGANQSRYLRQDEIFSHAIDQAPLVIGHRLPLVIQPIKYESQKWTGVEINLKEFSDLAFSGGSPASVSELIEHIQKNLDVDVEVIEAPSERIEFRSSTYSRFEPPVRNSKAKIVITKDADQSVLLMEALHFLFWRNRANRMSLVSVEDLKSRERRVERVSHFFSSDNPQRFPSLIRVESIALEEKIQTHGEELDIARFLLDRADHLKLSFMAPHSIVARFQENLGKLQAEIALRKKEGIEIFELIKKLPKQERGNAVVSAEEFLNYIEVVEEKMAKSIFWLNAMKQKFRL